MSATVIAMKVGGFSGSFNLDGSREYVLILTVETTAAGDGPYIVVNAAGVPRPGYVWAFGNEYDLGALCRSAVPRQISKFVWEVTCHYSSKSEDPEQGIENPLLRPPEVGWTGQTVQEAYERDVEGTATKNTVQDPFDPPLQRDRTRPILTITRNEAWFDHALADAYADALNSDPFYGYAPGCAKMSFPRANHHYENGIGFWQVTYEIAFRSDGWDDHPANRGCKHYIERNFQMVKIHAQEDGVDSTAPVYIAQNGLRIPENVLAITGPVYLTFKPYRRMQFAPLNLGG